MGNLKKHLALTFGFLTAISSFAFSSEDIKDERATQRLTTIIPSGLSTWVAQPFYNHNGPQSTTSLAPSPSRLPSIEEDEEDEFSFAPGDESGSDLEAQDCEDYMEYGREHNRD